MSCDWSTSAPKNTGRCGRVGKGKPHSETKHKARSSERRVLKDRVSINVALPNFKIVVSWLARRCRASTLKKRALHLATSLPALDKTPRRSAVLWGGDKLKTCCKQTKACLGSSQIEVWTSSKPGWCRAARQCAAATRTVLRRSPTSWKQRARISSDWSRILETQLEER